jgi:hypothetical protein
VSSIPSSIASDSKLTIIVCSVLATIGLYQDGVMKKDVDGKETIGESSCVNREEPR